MKWRQYPAPLNAIRGEETYEQTIRELFGEPPEGGFLRVVEVTLALEPDNPVDPWAIRAEVEGQRIGYLATEICAAVVGAQIESKFPCVVYGLVRGGSLDFPSIGIHVWLEETTDRNLLGLTIPYSRKLWVAWPPHSHEGK